MKTLQAVIESAARDLDQAGVVCGHGTDNVRDEAAWLACYALGLSPVEPLHNRIIDEQQEARVADWVQRRITSRQPTAYLTGEAWFAGLPFYVDEAVLVPRSPMAELIGEAFAPWLDAEKLTKVLDLCTGSGCIGIACALALPGVQVDVADISTAALAVATRNIQRHAVADRVRALRSDFFSALDGCCYDLIVTNPPYVPAAEAAALPAEYRAEPALGLASGDDGLDAACVILHEAARYLNPGGHLIMEVGDSWQALQSALPGVPFMWLEFRHGGDGVLIITREELTAAAADFAAWRQERHRNES